MGRAALFSWLLIATQALSQTNAPEPEQIPPLHPPRAEIPPGFWEQHGHWVIVGCITLLFGLAIAIYFWARPRPPVIPPPEVIARKSLGALQGRPEDGAVLSEVSQIIRRYVTSAFEMPSGELTTTEFCLAVEQESRIGPELSAALGEFLRRCDERKFAPSTAGPELKAVVRALELIDIAESRRAQLRAAAATAVSQNSAASPRKA